MKVCKFGGTSMANSDTIKKVAEICLSDKDRHYIIVSAPGKRDSGDIKVTDALYKCYNDFKETGNCDEAFEIVRKRFNDIKVGLELDLDIDSELDEIKKGIMNSSIPDYTASRGEYLSAKILASYLGYEFVDSKDLIKFTEKGNMQMHYSLDMVQSRLENVEYAVIPGFYGATNDDTIRTFSRGGSDISGAVVARAMKADVYENWTDVDGFLTTDPRVVDHPDHIDYLSYQELRELSYMGAEVLHPESIFPVRSVGIPINIKNTFNPSHPGTMIVKSCDLPQNKNVITGIAGKKGFTIINIEKSMMNGEIGFVRKVLSILEFEEINFEHIPSGIDTLSIVIRDDQLNGKMQRLVSKIKEGVLADSVEIHSGLSLIATVGHNMASRSGTASTIFKALADSNINIRMIDQGSSELNIIVGVDTFDYEKAINAIYHAFR